MSYKTILVHLNDRRGAEVLLEPAITLASQYNSHLIGMCVYSSVPAVTPALWGASGPTCHRRAQEDRGGRRHIRAP